MIDPYVIYVIYGDIVLSYGSKMACHSRRLETKLVPRCESLSDGSHPEACEQGFTLQGTRPAGGFSLLLLGQ